MRRVRPEFSYANVMASLALFVALSSGAYAAAVLPKNSVGPNQIAPNAVGSSEIKDDAVTSDAVKNGTLKEQDLSPAARKAFDGVTGAAGPAGAPGSPGPAGGAGPSGAAGIEGPAGASGSRGATGPTGAQGLPGTVGMNGLPGATGPTGVRGIPGATGPAGQNGSASAWARVNSNGTVGENLFVANATEKTPVDGVSCLNVLTSTPLAVVATLNSAAVDPRDTIVASVNPSTVAATCEAGANVVVTTWSFSLGAPKNSGYYVIFN